MKRLLFIILMSGFFTSYLTAQDIIVTNDGESLKVFNLDIGKKDIYYQLTNDEDAEVKRMPKSNVLIIRKADGTKIDPNATEQTKAPKPISRALRTYTKHKVQTAVATTGMQKKKKLSYFLAKTEDEQTFAFSILSETEKTVMVVEYEYEGSEIAIPEYVEFNGSRYTVTEIGEKAFSRLIISKISFPRTLKRIQKKGCFRVPLEKVILPEGLEIIEDLAFTFIDQSPAAAFDPVVPKLTEIFIPTTVKSIGKDCFRLNGKSQSYRGYYKGYISCLPEYVTEANCKDFGIDEEAVRAYYEALKLQMNR